MKILWLTNIPSPYRVDFFNILGEMTDLTVIFEKHNSKERDEKWGKYNFDNFKGIILDGINIGSDKSLSLKIKSHLTKGYYDHIIVSNPFTPTGILAINILKFKGISYSIVSDGGFPKSGKGFKEQFKKSIIKRANVYFSTAEIHDEYYIQYGAKKENIFRYPFSSIREADILQKPINLSEKNSIKSEIGIKEKKMILSIGQFVYRKGFDLLLRAFENSDKDVGLYIIGGKPTDEYLKILKDLNLKNVYFEEFKTKKQLDSYFKAADLFVLPTREDIWGLVVNEAMSFGLPVITTDKCIAGLQLIKEGENGYITPVNNIKLLTEKINIILRDEHLARKMSFSSLKVIEKYTIEKMAEKTYSILATRK